MCVRSWFHGRPQVAALSLSYQAGVGQKRTQKASRETGLKLDLELYNL